MEDYHKQSEERRTQLKLSLKHAYQLLEEYDQKILFESSPGQKAKYQNEREEVRQQILEYERELSPIIADLRQRIKVKQDQLDKKSTDLQQLELQLDNMLPPEVEKDIRTKITWTEGRIKELIGEFQKLEAEQEVLLRPQPPTQNVPTPTDTTLETQPRTQDGAAVGDTTLEIHLREFETLLRDGNTIITVLGPGINQLGRTANQNAPGDYPPSSAELTKMLIEKFNLPANELPSLAQVAQYATVVKPAGPLYDRLRELLKHEYKPNKLHFLLAEMPGRLRRKGLEPNLQIIITTCYDTLLEDAFDSVRQPYHLLSYAFNRTGQLFLHRKSEDTTWLKIKDYNNYPAVLSDKRPVIIKVYGALDLKEAGYIDSPILTEDQFIKYMSGGDNYGIPSDLMNIIKMNSLLFLGYEPRDWSMRVMLYRIWAEREDGPGYYRSWVISPDSDPFTTNFWKRWKVEVVPVNFEDYIASLEKRLEDLPDIKR